MSRIKKMSTHLLKTFKERKDAAAIGSVSAANARDASLSVFALMNDLKSVYRFKDVKQVSLLCRAMRKWDEDNVPDKEATEFGEFILKVGDAVPGYGIQWHCLQLSSLTASSCCALLDVHWEVPRL